MSEFRDLYLEDLRRYRGGSIELTVKRLLYHFRRAQTCKNSILQRYHRCLLRVWRGRRGIDFSWRTEIGRGLYLGHAYNITIGPNVRIGEYCNLHKGATLGKTIRGERAGSPIIGNRVWIGINATVVGGITIGDDVLIAPGAYVNFDVPNHSVVIGNPGVIHHKDNATEGYIIVPSESASVAKL